MNGENMNMNVRLELQCEDRQNLEASLIGDDNLTGELAGALCEILQKYSGSIQPLSIRISLATPLLKREVVVGQVFLEIDDESSPYSLM